MMKTQNCHGVGFVVPEVPMYLAEDYKAHPANAFKGKAAAVKRADFEAMWATKGGMEDAVEGVVAAQIEGFDGYWFVIWIYTDAQAAKSAERAAVWA